MTFINDFTKETISTGILLIVVFIVRIIVSKLIRRYAKLSQIIEHRTKLVVKYIHLLINIIAVFTLILIWGVETKDLFFTISSLTTVLGVGMFAQWSILSNITSGIILFFSFPFKIGDIIRIHDKEFPFEAEIEDIRAFHIYMKTKDGEMITYPNNLLLQRGISIIKHSSQVENEFTD
jgi:small-conductance mechanosensitive channel